jgi:cytochrome P450
MDSMLRRRGDKEGLSLEEREENANIPILAGSETTAAVVWGYVLASSDPGCAR